MVQTAFDTLSAAKRLEEDFDFSAKQAEGAAKLVYENLAGDVASKADIAALEEKMATKADLATAKYDLTWRLLGGIAILNGIFFAALRYLPPAG